MTLKIDIPHKAVVRSNRRENQLMFITILNCLHLSNNLVRSFVSRLNVVRACITMAGLVELKVFENDWVRRITT